MILTVNHINECSKLAKKKKKKRVQNEARLSWKGDSLGIVQEILNNTDKWYMHKPEFVLENETHKIFSEFETQKIS